MSYISPEADTSTADELNALASDGHLFDAALVALADAQAELGSACLAHLEACEHCSARLEEAAELSFAFDLSLTPSVQPALPTFDASAQRAAPRMPRKALVAALGLAALGSLPSLLRGAPAFDLRRLVQTAAVTARALNQALHSPRLSSSLLATTLPFLLAALLLAFGAAVALRQSAPSRKHHA